MRPETAPRTRSGAPLHRAPTASTYSSPLQFSLGKWQGFAMEENGLKKELWLKLTMWLQNIGAKGEY
jgi:hypothetical protein